MKVQLNGEEKIVEGKKNILQIVNEYKINPQTIVIEYNLNILNKDEYEKTFVKEGDRIEFVRFMGGG